MRALEHVRSTQTCPMCGLPKSICRDSKNESRFRSESERCFATKAVHAAQRADETAKIPDPGSLVYDISVRG